jgi:hypothetical protein
MGNISSRVEMADLFSATMDNISSHIKMEDLLRPTTLVILAITIFSADIVRRIIKLRAALAGIGNLPGRRTACGPFTLLASILPQIPYINLRAGWQFREKYSREYEVLCVPCPRF